MKRFTLMLMAAFIAVVTFANGETKNNMPVLQANAIVKPSKQIVPTKKFTQKAQNSASDLRTRLEKASALCAKATRRAGIDDIVGKDYMLISDYYEVDEDGQLVEATPSAGGTPIKFSKVDASTIAIEGFRTYATEKILATYSEDVDAELANYNVIATISIENGQTLYNSSYGHVALLNAAEEESPIEGYIFSDGTVLFINYWYTALSDGDYAGYPWDDFIYSSNAVVANGEMTWGEESAIVYIDQDEEAPKYVTVYNFGNYETAVDIEISYEGTFIIPKQLVGSSSSQGDFYTYGLNEDESNLIALTGTVNRASLDFDSKWTCYSDAGYWYGAQEPATISFTDGTKFTIPEAPQDIAAMPANPEVLKINEYNAENGYGSVLFTIPTTDVDGNDLVLDKLFYQLYTKVNGVEKALTFEPGELYTKITETMSIIPYTFTDNWDFADKGTYKIIFINEPFDWDFVGVKSIYTGGGATNETEIQWFDVKAATGISTVKANVKATNGAMFNLAGQRVAEGYKGLVIKNGKKYVVK